LEGGWGEDIMDKSGVLDKQELKEMGKAGEAGRQEMSGKAGCRKVPALL